MKTLKIVKKTYNEELTNVFDIEVEHEHHYLIEEDGIVSHNSGPIYLSDIVVSINKFKLRADEDKESKKDGSKKAPSSIQGIRSTIKCVKSRYAKPFEQVEVLIPYDTGMNPYSGLFDMFKQRKTLLQDGKKWLYTSKETGKEYKLFESEIKADTGLLEMLMREYDDSQVPVGVDETPEVDDVE